MPPKPKSGLRLLAGLPENNGLGPASGAILDDPGAPVYVVARLAAEDEVKHLATGTSTAVVRIEEVEIMTGDREDAARELLNSRRGERRSEEREQAEAEAAERGEIPLPLDGGEEPPEEAPTFEQTDGATDAAGDAIPAPAPAPGKGRRRAKSD